MEIVQVCRNLVSLGNVAVVAVFRAGYGHGFSKSLGLLESLVGPDSGVEVSGLPLKVVHRYVEELHTCAATQEHDFVGVGDVEQLFPERAALVHSLFPTFGAV